MGSPHLVGKSRALGELLSDANVSRREYASVCAYVDYIGRLEGGTVARTAAARLGIIFKAIAEKDCATADKILRLWGIR